MLPPHGSSDDSSYWSFQSVQTAELLLFSMCFPGIFPPVLTDLIKLTCLSILKAHLPLDTTYKENRETEFIHLSLYLPTGCSQDPFTFLSKNLI